MREERRDDIGVHVPGRCGEVEPAQFFEHDGIEFEVAACTAILLGNTGAKETDFPRAPPDFARSVAVFFPFRILRDDLGFQKATNAAPEGFVFFLKDRSLKLESP